MTNESPVATLACHVSRCMVHKLHQKNNLKVNRGCTLGGVYVPCSYSCARWVTVGNSGLCCHVRHLLNINWLPLLILHMHPGPHAVSDNRNYPNWRISLSLHGPMVEIILIEGCYLMGLWNYDKMNGSAPQNVYMHTANEYHVPISVVFLNECDTFLCNMCVDSRGHWLVTCIPLVRYHLFSPSRLIALDLFCRVESHSRFGVPVKRIEILGGIGSAGLDLRLKGCRLKEQWENCLLLGQLLCWLISVSIPPPLLL